MTTDLKQVATSLRETATNIQAAVSHLNSTTIWVAGPEHPAVERSRARLYDLWNDLLNEANQIAPAVSLTPGAD